MVIKGEQGLPPSGEASTGPHNKIRVFCYHLEWCCHSLWSHTLTGNLYWHHRDIQVWLPAGPTHIYFRLCERGMSVGLQYIGALLSILP